MKELTKAEEQIIQILWEEKKGFVKNIIEHLPEPKPAYNTVSTIIRILEKKGFVSHKAYGKTYEYYPLISKKKYTKVYFKNFVHNYFSNSFQQMVSFFAKEEDLSLSEMEEMKNIIEEEINKQKINSHE
ncbi:MAG: BlaI/MecI/CopY family transcriptional regulator [Bacteroidetes bacterium]|nr:BlaI/MecI/CopY family transcriptional regulator [Bacteroidota bacterium]